MSAPVNSCSRCTSYFTSILLVMLMVLSVIRNGNGLSYTTFIIGLHSGTVLASFPSFISSSVSSTFSSSAANTVQIKPPSSLIPSTGVLSPSLVSSSASSSAFSPSLSSNLPAPSSASSSAAAAASPPSSSSSPSFTQSSVPSLPCDFDVYAQSGCEDDTGSFCDTSQKCSCKDDHPIRLLGYCLKMKAIGEECYTSAQCKSINNAACYIFGKEYDNERISGGHNVGRQVSNWPIGNCRCNLGHQWDNATETCIKKTIGSWCNDDWDCIKDKYNTQCSRPQNLCECAWGFFYDAKTDSCQTPKLWGQKCISNADCEAENFICSSNTFKCVCPSGFHFDAIHPGCKVNADSSCERGYRWDEVWGRCIPNRSPGPVFPSLTAIHGIRTKSTSSDRTDSSGSSVHSSKPDSNNESGSSSVTTLLILILPNVIAFALILRYCYYRKREEDSSDLADDLERGNFAIRSAHLHNLTKFCAYPPYSTATRTILPGSTLKGHQCTVVAYPGDITIGTCCIAPLTTATGKVVHGKSTLESVEETDEPVGSLNQDTPEGETALDSSSAPANASPIDEKEKNKSSTAAGQCEEQKSKKNDHFTATAGALDDDALVTSASPHSRSSSTSAIAAAPVVSTTSTINNSQPECSTAVTAARQEDGINLVENNCSVLSEVATAATNITALSSSSPSFPPTAAFATCAVKNDKKESDLATYDVKSTSHVQSTSPKVTLVKYSPNSSANKVQLELVDDCGDDLHQRTGNVDSFTSVSRENIDRQSSHFILRETTSDLVTVRDGSKSSSPAPAMATSPNSRKHSTPPHEQLPVQQDSSSP